MAGVRSNGERRRHRFRIWGVRNAFVFLFDYEVDIQDLAFS